MASHDIIDLRTLADEWKYEIIGVTRPTELDEATKPYRDLCEELGIDKTPDDLDAYGNHSEPTLIHEDYFERYAEDLAEEIGAIDRNARWPLNHIDWEAAARDLRQDYTSVEYDGSTYYMRST